MARNPYKQGDYVIGDEPLAGRTEGIVLQVSGVHVGLRAAGSAEDDLIYYDYRDIMRPA